MVEAPGIETGEAIPGSTSPDNAQPEHPGITTDLETPAGPLPPVSASDDGAPRKTVSNVSRVIDLALAALDAGDVEAARALLSALRSSLEK